MTSKDNLSIRLKVKYTFICIRMSHAYRYRLLEQYSGKRERGKFTTQISLLHQLSRQPRVFQLNQIECVPYLNRALIYLSRFLWGFAAFWRELNILSSDHRSINIFALEANFPTTSRRHAFFPAKSTRFWRPKSLFSTPEPSPSWLVLRARPL